MVLVAMKAVVISCKTITEDIEGAEATMAYNDNERGMLANAKGQLSASLSGLMAVAKAHAAGSSWGPDALVSATNNLTGAVNELARAAGTVRPEMDHVDASSQPPAQAVMAPQVVEYPPQQPQQPRYSPPQPVATIYEPPPLVERPPSSYSARGPPAAEQPAPITSPVPQAAQPTGAQSQTDIVELDELKVRGQTLAFVAGCLISVLTSPRRTLALSGEADGSDCQGNSTASLRHAAIHKLRPRLSGYGRRHNQHC
jgi:hypothetical protein